MITASTTSAPVRVRVATSRAFEPRLARFAPRSLPRPPSRPFAGAHVSRRPGGRPRASIDRDNLDERYYRGFLEVAWPRRLRQADGRDTLTASVKLGAQATAVLGALFTAFMWSNGLL